MQLSGTPAPPVVAAFDFDGTLTHRDTLMPFLLRGVGWPRLLLAMVICSPWLLGYALGRVANDVAKQKLLLATLKGAPLEQVRQWTDLWLRHDFPGQLQDWTKARLAWHRQQGHCCVIVSASPDIYLARVASVLGFDGLICTEMEVRGDALTGMMASPNCHGEQKVIRLEAWLDARYGGSEVMLYAYGDTSGDKPMLRMAAHAWYRGVPWAGES